MNHCMKKISLTDEFEDKDVAVKVDGAFSVKSQTSLYTVRLGSDDTLPFCSCADFRQTYLPCKHFFVVFKFTDKTWKDLSSMYTESPYLNIDDKCLSSAYPDSARVQPESPTATSLPKPARGMLSHQRAVVAELELIKNLVYDCNSIDTLSSAKEKLSDIKRSLLKSVPREGGLPIASVRPPLIRKLPGRKRYYKINRKYSKRVGKQARIMKNSVCTGKNM